MTIELPQPERSSLVSVEAAIQQRRTQREYSLEPISLGEVAQLLWAAQGVTGNGGERAAPSAGAHYPLTAYLAAGAVSGLGAGLYGYDGETHSLGRVAQGDFRAMLREAALEDQPWVANAAATLVIAANFKAAEAHFHTQPPPGLRGARYVYLETGAAAENVHLQATALGLGLVLVAGFDDEKVKDVLELPEELEATALLCVGARVG